MHRVRRVSCPGRGASKAAIWLAVATRNDQCADLMRRRCSPRPPSRAALAGGCATLLPETGMDHERCPVDQLRQARGRLRIPASCSFYVTRTIPFSALRWQDFYRGLQGSRLQDPDGCTYRPAQGASRRWASRVWTWRSAVRPLVSSAGRHPGAGSLHPAGGTAASRIPCAPDHGTDHLSGQDLP